MEGVEDVESVFLWLVGVVVWLGMYGYVWVCMGLRWDGRRTRSGSFLYLGTFGYRVCRVLLLGLLLRGILLFNFELVRMWIGC